MMINLNIPDLPEIEEEDFGYDETPTARQDLIENNILWGKEGSKTQTKVNPSSIGDTFFKSRDADSEFPGSQLKHSKRVLHLTRELEKNFTVERRNLKDRIRILDARYSTPETRDPTPGIETLYKAGTRGRGYPTANTFRSRSKIAIGTPLVDGTRINRVTPEPNHKAKVSKFKNAFISGTTLGTKQDSIAEEDPLDNSIVVTNNQAIRKSSRNVIFNNDHSINIQTVQSPRDTRALGVPKKYTPKDKKKE
jgi:hypothetical protein